MGKPAPATKPPQKQAQQPIAKPEPATAPPQAKPKRDQQRLPDASAFAVTYSEATKSWSGTLTIGATVFDGKATGVFRLLEILDAAYRSSLGTATSTATG